MPRKREKKDSVIYKVAYRYKRGKPDAEIVNLTFFVSNIRSLAKKLNVFVQKNPHSEVLGCWIVDKNGVFIDRVHFLEDEYRAQYWLTGWKERLLASALDRGYDLSWNTGLKSKSKKL